MNFFTVKFFIQLLVYIFFGTLSLCISCPEIQINFLMGWIAFGVSEGVYYMFLKRRKPNFKFIAYPHDAKTFTNQCGKPINIYSGHFEENGTTAIINFIGVVPVDAVNFKIGKD